MYTGWPSPCLNVRDLDASTRFYEALGMEVMAEVSAAGQRTILRSGVFRLGLFAGIAENVLNFRGADVFAVHEALAERLPGLEGTPRRYEPGPEGGADYPGACWMTRDPDGNGVFFDTNRSEEGEAFRRHRVAQVLRDTEDELVRVGAPAECLEALRSQLIRRFGAPEPETV